MLYLVGIGLCDEKDITVKGLEAVKKADVVYLENYTAVLQVSVDKLEKFYGKKIIVADRKLVEQEAEKTILKDAKEKNVILLVVGDPVAATTHTDLITRAEGLGIKVEIIHNSSIFTTIGSTGLQLYKFGKTTSMPFPEKNFFPETAYDVLKTNKKNGLHTLVLFDLRPNEKRFMTINEGLKILLEIEKKRKEKVISENMLVLGCARLGCGSQIIKYGKIIDLINFDFGKPMHCIIIPGEMHFTEEDYLKKFS